MKTKMIFRGTVAGLMSISLLLSGLPVMGAGLTETQPYTDVGNQALGEETQQKPGQSFGRGLGEPLGEDKGIYPGKEPGGNTWNSSGEEPGKSSESRPGEEPVENTESQPGESLGDQPGNDSEERLDNQPEEGKANKDGKDNEVQESQKVEGIEEEGAREEFLEAFSLDNLQVVNGNIAVDGNFSDWAEVAERTSSDSGLSSWKVAYSKDKSTLFVSYSGMASSEWDYNFAGNSNVVRFIYGDGHTGADDSVFVNAWKDGAVVKDAFWGDIPGAAAAVVNEANGNNPGVYRVEFSIPLGFLHSTDFILEFGGVSLKAEEIQQLNGKEVTEEEPSVYRGIMIDGSYLDWAAVARIEADCPNQQHKGCISQVAAIFDGDWFYIYVRDGKGSNASSAGSHSNGKFAITSDLGYETDIQLTTAPTVNGVNGAQVAYVGSQWEIAIPKDQLPKYRQSLSFGLYLEEPLVKDIVNLQEDNGNNLENLFQGIVYDGSYEDWEDYGHSTIQYATAGSQESQVDAKGALYSSGDRLYGHVVTTMPQHLQEAGGEFTSAVTIAFNQKQSDLQNGAYDQRMVFYPRFVTVASDGNINWNPQLSGLAEGTYEFYIASTDAWGTSSNIHNAHEMDQMYGRMIMTLGKDGKDEMEFYLELPLIAKKLGVGETELKQIAGQFGRIGQQWIYTAGASTGPFAGVVFCAVAVGLAFWDKKKQVFQFLFYSAK